MDGVPVLLLAGPFLCQQLAVGDGERFLPGAAPAALRQDLRRPRPLQLLRVLQARRLLRPLQTLYGTLFRRARRRRHAGWMDGWMEGWMDEEQAVVVAVEYWWLAVGFQT